MTHAYVFYIVYCIDDKNRILTYEGITNNLSRRLRKHRGEIKGGAKFTTRYSNRGCYWHLGATAHGFKSHQEVLQFEFAIHNPRRSKYLKILKTSFSNHYTRNVHNMFFLSTQGHYNGHTWAVIHDSPAACKLQFEKLKIINYTLISPTLLLENYQLFFKQHCPTNTNVATTPIPGNQYRDAAKRLLELAHRRSMPTSKTTGNHLLNCVN
jgi:predicted GIY-YIG superfamily endonuclease